jgi:hypothetical protein
MRALFLFLAVVLALLALGRLASEVLVMQRHGSVPPARLWEKAPPPTCAQCENECASLGNGSKGTFEVLVAANAVLVPSSLNTSA